MVDFFFSRVQVSDAPLFTAHKWNPGYQLLVLLGMARHTYTFIETIGTR